MQTKELFGELIGTFLLVLGGCSTVAAAVTLGAIETLPQVALLWGASVAIAIFATRAICPAHLNPAVSLAMVFSGNMKARKLPAYFLAQLIGAFLAGWVVYFIFHGHIEAFEIQTGIVRGTPESKVSASMFGEYFPNPGRTDLMVSWWQAALWEGGGTFALLVSIYILTQRIKIHKHLVPVLIGLTVTGLIILIAPYTQAGINPARDFGPRLVAWLSGWGDAAFPFPSYSFFTVYILAPLLGGTLAGCLFRVNAVLTQLTSKS